MIGSAIVQRTTLWLAIVGACSSASTGPERPLKHPVLFIGNSLTYVNDLPATVQAIAAAAGDTIDTAAEAGPNLALIDHWNGATNALAAIRKGGWEFVILQQGPTTQGICRDSLILWTTMFAPEIKAVGAQPALLMTWPTADRPDQFDAVRISFSMAAKAVGGVFLPAGEAWRAALAAAPNVGVYGTDGFHPSPVGTFLTALTIYERISGRDVRTLPPQAFANGRPFSLPETTVRLLQQAAHDANQQFPADYGSPPSTPVNPARATVDHC